MADENLVVESSSAAPAEETQATSAPWEEVSLDRLTAEQYDKWKLDGSLPAKQAKSPAAKKTNAAPDESGKPKGNQETGKGTKLRERISDLDGEIESLQERLARKADLTRQLEPEKGAQPASPAAEPKSDELKPPAKPKLDDFKTYEEYEAAKDKYFEDLSDYKVTKALQEDRKARAQEAESKTVAERWNKAVDETAKEVGTEEWNKAQEAARALFDGKDRGLDLPAKYIVESEVGPQITYYFGTHPEELKSLAKLSPIQQIEKLAEIKLSLLKPERESRVPRETPGPKRITEVPPPPKDIQARGGAPKDPVEAALDSGDTGAYIRAANARDIAAFKARGR